MKDYSHNRTRHSLDIVKYPFVGLPLDEALNTYTFKLTGITSHDGMLFYEVQFEPAAGDPSSRPTSPSPKRWRSPDTKPETSQSKKTTR